MIDAPNSEIPLARTTKRYGLLHLRSFKLHPQQINVLRLASKRLGPFKYKDLFVYSSSLVLHSGAHLHSLIDTQRPPVASGPISL